MQQQFYTATDVARLFGVSDKNIQDRCKSGTIPAEKRRNEMNNKVWHIAAEWVHENMPDTSGATTGGTSAPPPHPTRSAPEGTRNTPPEAPHPPRDILGNEFKVGATEAPEGVTGGLDNETLNITGGTGGIGAGGSGAEMVVHMAAVEHHEGEASGISVAEFMETIHQMIESNRILAESNEALAKEVAELRTEQGRLKADIKADTKQAVSEEIKGLNIQDSDDVKQIVLSAVKDEIAPLHKQIEEGQNKTGDQMARMSEAFENVVAQVPQKVGILAAIKAKFSR